MNFCLLYRLFEKAPESKELFKRVNVEKGLDDPDFQAHALRVLTGLDRILHLMSDVDAMDAELDHLIKDHGEMKINGEYFWVGSILTFTTVTIIWELIDHICVWNLQESVFDYMF